MLDKIAEVLQAENDPRDIVHVFSSLQMKKVRTETISQAVDSTVNRH